MLQLLREIILKRSLLYELVRKEMKTRYVNSSFGFFWTFLSPFLIVVIFYVVFSLLLRVRITEAPFVLYLMSAVFPWRFFQDSLTRCVTSLVDNRNLIKETNFPHYFIPLSITLANGIVFLPCLFILLAASFLYSGGLPYLIIWLPAVLFIHLIITVAISIGISILYIKWRDLKYVLEAVLLVLFYSIPVFYSLYSVKSALSPFLFKLFLYNPFVGILTLYRLTIIKGFVVSIAGEFGLINLIIIPLAFTIAWFCFSLYLYKKNRYVINDYLSY